MSALRRAWQMIDERRFHMSSLLLHASIAFFIAGLNLKVRDDDADYPALQPAYHTVQLTHLDGSGFLHGDYAYVVSETGNPAYSPTNTFSYNRHQDEFEQVMAYYWITEAQKYIQSLGYRVRVAFDGPSALKAARETSPRPPSGRWHRRLSPPSPS